MKNKMFMLLFSSFVAAAVTPMQFVQSSDNSLNLKNEKYLQALATTSNANDNIATKAPISSNISKYGEAHLPNAAILSMVNEAMVSLFSYDYVNYDKTFQQVAAYFTPVGWIQALQRHSDLGDLNLVKKNKAVASAVALSPAKIISQGKVGNRYTWVVEVEYLVKITSGSFTEQKNILSRLMVVRDNPEVHDRGLAIDKIAIKILLAPPNKASNKNTTVNDSTKQIQIY